MSVGSALADGRVDRRRETGIDTWPPVESGHTMADHLIGLLVLLAGIVVLGWGVAAAARSGGRAFARGLDVLRRSRVPIADVNPVEGTTTESVAIQGTVRDVGEFASGFTGSPSVCSEYEIERRERSDSLTPSEVVSSTSWKTVATFSDRAPFVLEDDSGRIRVEPGGADLELETADSFEVGNGRMPSARVESYLEGTRHAPASDERRRYTERNVAPRTVAHVVGPVERDPDASDDPDVTTVVRAAAGDGPFVVSNTDKAATVRRIWWRGGRAFALAIVWLGLLGVAAVFLL